MKAASEVLGAAQFRRVAFPGLVFALGIHPFLMSWFGDDLKVMYGASGTVLFLIQVVFWGMLVSSGTKDIYYIYEGFKFRWITWPLRFLLNREFQRRYKKWESLLKQRDELLDTDSGLSKIEEELALATEALEDFPLVNSDSGPEYRLEQNSLLGNIIAAYELYPESRYGFDGVSLWYHLLHLAPEASRASFEEKVHFADALVLSSASGYALTMFGLILLVIKAAVPSLILPLPPMVLLGVGLAVGVLFYKLALAAQRDTGVAFRALVDLTARDLSRWISEFKHPSDATTHYNALEVVEYLRFLRRPDR